MSCPLCPKVRDRYRIIPDGPIPARVMFLGEQPAREEDRFGRPFVGRTGREFNELYLPIAGIPRSEVLVYNARGCSNLDYSNPTPLEAESCSSIYLGNILAEVRPQILVTMGLIASGLFKEIEDLNLQHGIPLPGRWGSWQGVLFPMYHPSAGMRSTGYMIALMQDFDRLGKLVKELESL